VRALAQPASLCALGRLFRVPLWREPPAPGPHAQELRGLRQQVLYAPGGLDEVVAQRARCVVDCVRRRVVSWR
jgi:hypothetical protein